MLTFDPAKDAANIAKHGVSLTLADGFAIQAYRIDTRRDYGEVRYIAFGLIGLEAYCLVFADRNGDVRAISLRRAHAKEYRRHVRKVDLSDPENPEWTAEDFASAKGPESLPAHVLAAFPKTRGRPRLAQPKQPVSLRLSPDVLAYYKATGAGWQGRIEAVLKAAMPAKAPGRS